MMEGLEQDLGWDTALECCHRLTSCQICPGRGMTLQRGSGTRPCCASFRRGRGRLWSVNGELARSRSGTTSHYAMSEWKLIIASLPRSRRRPSAPMAWQEKRLLSERAAQHSEIRSSIEKSRCSIV